MGKKVKKGEYKIVSVETIPGYKEVAIGRDWTMKVTVGPIEIRQTETDGKIEIDILTPKRK